MQEKLLLDNGLIPIYFLQLKIHQINMKLRGQFSLLQQFKEDLLINDEQGEIHTDHVFCQCVYKLLGVDNRCEYCQCIIQHRVNQLSVQSSYDANNKCITREENINNITQIVIHNIFSLMDKLVSRKKKKQTDNQTTVLKKYFKDEVQGAILMFIKQIQDAGIKKNLL